MATAGRREPEEIQREHLRISRYGVVTEPDVLRSRESIFSEHGTENKGQAMHYQWLLGNRINLMENMNTHTHTHIGTHTTTPISIAYLEIVNTHAKTLIHMHTYTHTHTHTHAHEHTHTHTHTHSYTSVQ